MPSVSGTSGEDKSLTECQTLPPGWRKRETVRKSGLSKGKTDVYYISPCGKTIRSKIQLIRYLGDQIDLSNFDYQTGAFLTDDRRAGAGGRMVRAKTVAGGSSRSGYANGTHKGSKSHVITTTRNGFDGQLTPPNRQTANIVRQPVTLVHTTSRDSRPAPMPPMAMETRSAAAMHRLNEKPRQMFWCRRLDGLRPMLMRPGQLPESAAPEPISLPNRIVAIGPEINETGACASLAAFLQTPHLPAVLNAADRDTVGQISAKKLLDSNPGVFTDPNQPLIQAITITEQDIAAQERRVLDARRRLEEALKHFG